MSATVERVPIEPFATAQHQAPAAPMDHDSRGWLQDLRAEGSTWEDAVARLHALLLGAARFEVARRRASLPHLRGNELDDIALEAADDALMSILAPRRLPRRQPVHDLGIQVRAARGGRQAAEARLAGTRDPPRARQLGHSPSDGLGPAEKAEQTELLHAVQQAIARAHSASAPCPRRARGERGTDRRSRRASRHHPRRAVQDPARRTPQAARDLDRGARARRAGGDAMTTPDLTLPAPRSRRTGGGLRGVLPGTRSLRRARARGRRRRHGPARPARPPRGLPRLPGGARQPARSRGRESAL